MLLIQTKAPNSGSLRPLAMNMIRFVNDLLLTRNFSKIDQNYDHNKCYLFTKEATWCDENLGLVAHWWPAKWQVEWRICKIRKCAKDAKYAEHATYAKCAVVAKFDKCSATSVTKILGVQHIGGKVTGWMYGRADYFFAQPTRKLGGQQPITHPLFIFCANNTSLFILQFSLSNSNLTRVQAYQTLRNIWFSQSLT